MGFPTFFVLADNMNNEILSVLEYMEKEKGINRKDMIPAITTAIAHAAQRAGPAGREVSVSIDPKTGDISAAYFLKVVESVSDSNHEIHIEQAKKYLDAPQLGNLVKRDIEPSFLGRIVAQASRQAIMQRVRQFERARVYDDFKDQVGHIVAGTVRRRDKGDLIVEIGNTEGILPYRERVAGEDYSPNERIRCLLLKIDAQGRGPELILSRSSVRFVRELLDLEVTEISDGTVSIRGMAREPGYRTKICVHADDPRIDPVGSCVGARGMRVKSIVRELGGEKVDVVRFYDDPKKMLAEALKPAIPKNVQIDNKGKRIYFEVCQDDLSVAIGRRGMNAKLTSKLIGWKLDIGKEKVKSVNIESRKAQAVASIKQINGLELLADRLVNIGITTPDALDGVTEQDLIDANFNVSEARMVIDKYQTFRRSN